jgi:hypothetical protein
MHLCYVNEAGSTGKNLEDRQQPIFVRACSFQQSEASGRWELNVVRFVDLDPSRDDDVYNCIMVSNTNQKVEDQPTTCLD